MAKKFCNKCEYLKKPQAEEDAIGVTYSDYKCKHASNELDDDNWLTAKKKYVAKPQDLNANNDCANYLAKVVTP